MRLHKWSRLHSIFQGRQARRTQTPRRGQQESRRREPRRIHMSDISKYRSNSKIRMSRNFLSNPRLVQFPRAQMLWCRFTRVYSPRRNTSPFLVFSSLFKSTHITNNDCLGLKRGVVSLCISDNESIHQTAKSITQPSLHIWINRRMNASSQTLIHSYFWLWWARY